MLTVRSAMLPCTDVGCWSVCCACVAAVPSRPCGSRNGRRDVWRVGVSRCASLALPRPHHAAAAGGLASRGTLLINLAMVAVAVWGGWWGEGRPGRAC